MSKDYTPRNPQLQPLKIRRGWTVAINKFCELDPKDLDPDDDIWLWHFHEDTLQLIHEYLYVCLDLGWYPDGNPNGCFRLMLVTDSWDEPVVDHITRDKQEIVDLIEKLMWEIAEIELGRKENRFGLERRSEKISRGILPDFPKEELVPPFPLQPLKIYPVWTILHNTFTEINPNEIHHDQPEIWQTFTGDLLWLANYHHKQILLRWEPAGDPNGWYVLRMFKDGNMENPTLTIKTRRKEEVVDWIEWTTLKL